MKFCGHCGASLEPESKFCSSCGETILLQTGNTERVEYAAKLAVNSNNLNVVGKFIQRNLFVIATTLLLLFIITSIHAGVGWIALLLAALVCYVYPLITSDEQTGWDRKIHSSLFKGGTSEEITDNKAGNLSTTSEVISTDPSAAPIAGKVPVMEGYSESSNVPSFEDVSETFAVSDTMSFSGEQAGDQFVDRKKMTAPSELNTQDYAPPIIQKKNDGLFITFAIIGLVAFAIVLFFLAGSYEGMAGGSILMLVVVGIAIYFIPSLISRGSARVAIFFVNLFFGWTLLVWVICLIWALSDNGRSDSEEQLLARMDADARQRMAMERKYREHQDRL